MRQSAPGRVRIVVSAAAGADVRHTGSLPADQEPYKNVNNPFEDASDREVENPLHGVIQVLNVPLNNPADTSEIAEPEISYPRRP